MNKLTKMAALMMTAVMCAFTSCSDSDKNEEDVATAPTAKVAMLTTPSTISSVTGTVTVEFKPSGKSQTLNIASATGKVDESMLAIVQSLNLLVDLSYLKTDGGCVECEFSGDINDTECVITPNLKAKDELDFSASNKYDFELYVPYKVVDSKGVTHKSSSFIRHGGVAADKFQNLVLINNVSETIKLK